MSAQIVKVVNTSGQPVRELELPKAVVEYTIKPVVVHQVVVGQAAGRRAGTAHTKTRAEVSGGGKKPWKQKGTGRARHGSIRSPIWVGGGVVHGPRSNRNYTQATPQLLRRKALAMVVADYLKAGRVAVVESFPAGGKTKPFAQLFRALGADQRRLVLLTDAEKTARQGLRNLSDVSVMGVRQLNPADGLRSPAWLVSEQGFQELLKFVR